LGVNTVAATEEWPGNFINYSYDNIGQLKTAQGFEQNGTTPRLQEQFGYAYDKAWNLNERTNNALIQTFAVNDLNELSSADQSGTLTVAGSSTEAFGDPGVTNLVVNGDPADLYADETFAAPGFTPANGENTFTAIAQDTYGRASTNSVTVNVTSGNNCTYDLNGNLTSDGTRNFAYDDENQLVAVWVANTWSNSFAYDGFMRKCIEQQFAWNGSGWAKTNEVHYIYDGRFVLQERDGNNEPLTTYTRGIDLSGTYDGAGGAGGLLARSDNQKIVPAMLSPENPNPQNIVTSYYFSDEQGNVVALVLPNGFLVAHYEYDPFGNLISKSGLMAEINKYRFSSKEWEQNAGLYYYGYRFYDPNLQRWLNRDPNGEPGFSVLQNPGYDSENSQESDTLGLLDLYLFAENNGLLFIDTDGLSLWTWIQKHIGGKISVKHTWPPKKGKKGKTTESVIFSCHVHLPEGHNYPSPNDPGKPSLPYYPEPNTP
jgi:RHS repeat-associated protein